MEISEEVSDINLPVAIFRRAATPGIEHRDLTVMPVKGTEVELGGRFELQTWLTEVLPISPRSEVPNHGEVGVIKTERKILASQLRIALAQGLSNLRRFREGVAVGLNREG